jgi:flavoprotein
VDHVEGKQVTTLPSGKKLELEMREVDLENTSKLAMMRSIHVFYSPSEVEGIIKKHSR